MKKLAYLLTVVAVCGLAAPATAGGEACYCKTIKASGNGWCDGCNGGAVYGIAIKSAKLFKALQGKEIKDPGKISCAGCKAAVGKNGSCDHCSVAFNDGKAYHASLAQILSRGNKVDAGDVKCSGCAKTLKSGKDGFCKSCDGGFVGGLAFHGKKLFGQAKDAMQTLRAAARTAKHCEQCAVAMVSDGQCNKCKVDFKDGKKVKTES